MTFTGMAADTVLKVIAAKAIKKNYFFMVLKRFLVIGNIEC
jgi:hypothetical protein